MNIGFGIYGTLMVLAAFQTYRHAVKREFGVHRAWGILLFALAIGSWLYRMDYGLWLTFTHRLGHTSDFRGPFDMVMAFFFYVPNLILAELFLRGRQSGTRSLKRAAIIVLLNLATAVSAAGSYYFVRFYWGPAIIQAITGKT